jgi:hypothetical protein
MILTCFNLIAPIRAYPPPPPIHMDSAFCVSHFPATAYSCTVKFNGLIAALGWAFWGWRGRSSSRFKNFIPGLVWMLVLPGILSAAPSGLFDPRQEEQESKFYRIETVAIPKSIVLEIGGMAMMPDGALMICTRRGEIWSLHNDQWKRFAAGLDEPLGLCVISSNQIVVAQRPELTRITDTDNDGVADRFETVTTAWNYTGHPYEFAFGPVRDAEGNLYGALACWFFSPKLYDNPPYIGWELEPPEGYQPNTNGAWRSWCFKVTPQGKFIPFASGFRSPNGLVITPQDELLIMENQGEFFGADALFHVTEGSFQGHPNSLFWGKGAVEDPFDVPLEQLNQRRAAPIVIYPYELMGRSASEPVFDLSEGKFGPFEGQLFVGDVTKSTIMRTSLQKVAGEYQGACYPFRRGFQSGNNRLLLDKDGRLWVGQTGRGWGSIGGRSYGLQRLVWTGEIPFEIQEMTLTADGFDLRFTKPVDTQSASDPAAYSFSHYFYRYVRSYFAPVMEEESEAVVAVRISEDRTRVSLKLPELATGRIYQLSLNGVKATDGSPPLHREAYYTLNRVMKDRSTAP